ncbi:leucine-rich repeat-containing protein 69-like, partial [Bradysia coprophila]|uniref:leucine-rich repeat-containing protein 69-like n=1 Tax=Bradysia coprophila TaxID=38358 RepID=UPI00187D8BB8
QNITLDLSGSSCPQDNNNGNCEYVEEICLQENTITSIPLWIFEIVHLKFLHLADNKIVYIPEEIGLLTCLEIFDISGNLIEEVPPTIGELKHLKVLNVSRNLIKNLPREIGRLESLEVLAARQNLISHIPDDLGDCNCLTELLLDDNLSINQIPPRIFALHQLKNVCIDRCSLFHLPYIKCTTLIGLKVCENYLLTHIPYYYESFITDDYTHQIDFELNEPLKDIRYTQIETVNEKRIIILPNRLTTIYTHTTSRHPLTLFHLCLSAAHKLFGYSNIIDGLLPPSIADMLKYGPVARCGGAFCNMYLFNESYVLILRRNHGRNDHAIISHLFCSKDCLDKWFEDKSYFYRQIEWKYLCFGDMKRS